ncbi:UNVERIFIED_CONTAM: hypothetical protein HDU68_001117 [Siphonaria sp. JEL0065]|nr:hypothetical protein HDU68_001117 [Siphonaria sp. JEL0065]
MLSEEKGRMEDSDDYESDYMDTEEHPEDVEERDPLVVAEELKQEANAKYKLADYKQAAALYTKAYDLVPSSSPTAATLLSNRSAAHTMSRSHALALRDCRASLAIDPSQPKLYLRGAKSLVFTGDLGAAKQFLKEGVNVFKNDKSKWDQADKLNDEVSAIDKIDVLISVAKDAIDAKEYLSALESIENAFTLADPSNTRKSVSSSSSSRLLSADLGNLCHKWKLIRAECLIGLLELGEASKVVSNQVLSYDSTNSEALALRAQILYLNNSHPLPNVIQFLTQALTFDPDNKRARLFLKKIKALEIVKKEGNDAYGQQDWDKAEEKYSEWLEEDFIGGVVRAKVLSNRAMVRSKAGQQAKCISDCTTAIDLLTTLSFPKNKNNTSDEASEPTNADLANSLQSALFLKLHLRRADSYLKQEDYTEAVRDYQACSEIKPEDREIAAAMQRAKKAERAAKRKDYYKILGVDRGADENTIKKAYRKMALLYHPDKQAALPEEERATSDAKFKEISEAYSVLSDPQKKHMFDNGMDIDGSSASAGAGGNPFGGSGVDMEDIMRMFGGQMGGGFPGGGFQQQRGYGGQRHSHGGPGHSHGGHGGFGGFSFE